MKAKSVRTNLVHLLALGAAAIIAAPSSAETFHYGKAADLGGSSLHSPDFLLGFRITVDRPVDLLAAGVIFRTSGYHANIGVYSSSGTGFPDQLLATTGVFSVSTVGVLETPFSTVIQLTPGNYWFMADYDADASIGQKVGTFSQPTDPNVPDVIAYRYLPFTSTLPSTFGTATLYKWTEMNYYLKTQSIPEPATSSILLLLLALAGCLQTKRNRAHPGVG